MHVVNISMRTHRSGVCDLVSKHMTGKFQSLGVNVTIAKICVRDLSKPRDFKVQEGTVFVTDYNGKSLLDAKLDELYKSVLLLILDILNDPSINCVIELMGGVTAAKDVVFKAIASNKHVVTANKALIASYMPELQALLAAHPTVQFNYEAAVCGGIPIIHTLQSAFLSDTIKKVNVEQFTVILVSSYTIFPTLQRRGELIHMIISTMYLLCTSISSMLTLKHIIFYVPHR